MGPETLVLGGRFRVLRHIGGGGMSEVYLAVQLSLGRQVALKVLKRDLGKRPDMAERFRREALLLSTVDHPAVVRVIDFEPGADATILVLELAEGDTLEHLLKGGPIEPGRAVLLLAQLAEGLGAIHEKGIIHRDLKPQNVVISPTARGEQARLLDFGIARLIEMGELETLRGLPDNPMISHPGQVVGTPAFVAPEQATGKPLDARTDVYAFGVLAYRLLTGQFPFPGPSSNDFLKQHIGMAPKPLVEARPQLSEHPKLVALVMQCLEKNPDLRPQSANVLTEKLVELLPQSPYDSSVTTPSRRLLASATTTATPVPPEKGPEDSGARWRDAQAKAAAATQALLQVGQKGIGAAQSVPTEWKKSLLVVAALLLVAPAVWAMLPPTNGERVAKLLDQGRGEAALSLLDEKLQDASWEAPELYALKAATLHSMRRELDERDVLRTNPYQCLLQAHPLLLDALAEDFGRAEDDVELKALIKIVPAEILEPHFDRRSREKGSERQWGSLRWLDLSRKKDLQGALGARYISSLQATDCTIRGSASRRLAELNVREAIDALRALSETPKEKTDDGLVNCGQDEAAEAIRELKRE
ncbi:MAG: serine/threonine protein kinase [Myxococcaceae bacterium]|nr:serine/threonine protein kinase [Myxococcaceae bacterium]